MKRLHSINSVVLSISLLSLANAAFASEALTSATTKAKDISEAITTAYANGDYAQAEVLRQELEPVNATLQALQQEAAAGKVHAIKKACKEAFNNTQDRIRGYFATSKTKCYNTWKIIAGHPYIACSVVGTGIATYIIWKRYKQAKQQGIPFIPSYITQKINKTMANAKSTSTKIANKVQYS